MECRQDFLSTMRTWHPWCCSRPVSRRLRPALRRSCVYDDQLQNGFQDWSWATRDLHDSSTVHGGSSAISFEPDAWEAVYLHRDEAIDTIAYEALELWVHGGQEGGQEVKVAFLSENDVLVSVDLEEHLTGGAVAAGQWALARISFDDIGLSGVFNEVWFQDDTGGDQGTVFLDDIAVAERAGAVEPIEVTVVVDPDADRRPVNPRIYGVNRSSADDASELPFPVVRWGGNAATRYSWQDDVSNRASDWFFLNIPNRTDPATLPEGSQVDQFIDDARAAGSEVILTVPIIGWTPIDREPRWGFSIAKYGPQTNDECRESGYASWCNPDAGNGLDDPGGEPIVGNDPTDTSRAIGPGFVTDWMVHIAGRVGTAGAGGVRLFALDNEPMLWSSTHRDVHPSKLAYFEMWQRTESYAAAMKAEDADALVLGPVVWGWCAYYFSDADGCGNTGGTDYVAHGPFLEWYLDQAAAHEAASGVRLIDYLDIHYYPQASGVALSSNESAAVAARRLRSVKSLYDPGYVDESWIARPVRLIPEMREIVDAHHPGTRLAITEYSWGNDEGLTSALAQVEVLAIFGREGVDLATRWVEPRAGTRVEDAFAMFLDYDGAGSAVTGDSVRATSSDVDQVGAYGIRGADDTLYLVLVNKALQPADVELTVAGGLQHVIVLYGFGASSRLGPLGSITARPGAVTLQLPARSATLAVAEMDVRLPAPRRPSSRVR